MTRQVIASEELARQHAAPDLVRSGAFSPAVKAGPFIFVSGCAAAEITQDMRGQSEEAFRYMSLVLAEAGYAMSDVVKITAFITSVEEYGEYSEVRRKYFPEEPPGSSTLVCGLLFPGMKVEVEAIAYKEP